MKRLLIAAAMSIWLASLIPAATNVIVADAAVSTPTNVHVTATTQTTITLAWNGSTPKFAVWLDGTWIRRLSAHTYTFTGLTCGTTHRVGVRSVSGSNTSSIVYVNGATSACPTGTSPAMFGRINYPGTNTMPTQDAARYQLFDLQPDSTGIAYAKQLHAVNPNLIILGYQDTMVTRSGDPSGITTGVPYSEAVNHPDWFLYDSSGNKLVNQCNGGGCYAMDVGDTGYQAAWVTHALATFHDGAPWSGIFLDEVNETLTWTYGNRSAKYTTDAQWQAAMTSFLSYVYPRLQAAGALDWPNISVTSEPLWQEWAGLSDGGMIESFTDGGDGAAQQVPWDQQKLNDVAWSEAHGKLTFVNTYSSTEQGDVLAVAAMLLVANGHTYFGMANDFSDHRNGLWFPENDQARQLGAPLGAYYQEASGVYRRDFQNGYVRANLSTSAAGGLAATTGQIVTP